MRQNPKDLLAAAETSLEQDRYDRDKPRDLAREAKYTAQHAIYIGQQVRAVKKGKLSQEQQYLDIERPIADIAVAADIVPDFSAGPSATRDLIVEYIGNAERAQRELE